MAITRKPLSTIEKKIIEKGGSSPTTSNQEANNLTKITLRLPFNMLRIIDNYLLKHISKKNRTQWIKEAIAEKIEKDIEK